MKNWPLRKTGKRPFHKICWLSWNRGLSQGVLQTFFIADVVKTLFCKHAEEASPLLNQYIKNAIWLFLADVVKHQMIFLFLFYFFSVGRKEGVGGIGGDHVIGLFILYLKIYNHLNVKTNRDRCIFTENEVAPEQTAVFWQLSHKWIRVISPGKCKPQNYQKTEHKLCVCKVVNIFWNRNVLQKKEKKDNLKEYVWK